MRRKLQLSADCRIAACCTSVPFLLVSKKCSTHSSQLRTRGDQRERTTARRYVPAEQVSPSVAPAQARVLPPELARTRPRCSTSSYSASQERHTSATPKRAWPLSVAHSRWRGSQDTVRSRLRNAIATLRQMRWKPRLQNSAIAQKWSPTVATAKIGSLRSTPRHRRKLVFNEWVRW